jgi:flagellar biosynthetic protein FliR
MHFDAALLYSFLTVFVRCSAMLLSSPMFGAQNTPLQVRIMTTLAISAALTIALQPQIGPPPADMYVLAASVAHEVVAGLLIGMFMSLVLLGVQMAGSLMDMQIGLGMSQALNPLTGVPSTVIGQFKFMLGLVVFLSMDAHLTMIDAFARSYTAMPAIAFDNLPALQEGIVKLLGAVSLLAIQIAAPVMGVTLVVDAALGLVNKAVPQMQVLIVGMPAKIVMGLIALSLGLPALVGGVTSGVGAAMDGLGHLFHMR